MPEINSADKYNLEQANKVEIYVVYDNIKSNWVPAVSIDVGQDNDLSYQEFVDLREAVDHTAELFDKLIEQYGSE